jgi:site-specific DNA-methyltransferase (adenine-specific)
MKPETPNVRGPKLWSKDSGAVGFKSKSTEWDTPQDFYDRLDRDWNFTLDPCATHSSAKCKKYFTIKDDGLAQDWAGHHVFVNPPYGRGIGEWIEKAHEESKKHNTIVVMLIPSRTDTKWWHNYVMKAKEIHFLKGRLKFGSSTNAAPFPSAIVVFHSDVMLPAPARGLVPKMYTMEKNETTKA